LSELQSFTRLIEDSYGLSFGNYSAFHQWCCDHPAEFWSTFLTLSLNYARCLLDNGADPDRPAVTVEDESGAVNSVSHVELTDLSMRIVSFLKLHGVTSGDRVVAIAKNSVESIAACIACAALGASWSSVALTA